MKKANEKAAFNTAAFTGSIIGFLFFINVLFFVYGTFFAESGYVFDFNKNIINLLPGAFLCGICAAFYKKREA